MNSEDDMLVRLWESTTALYARFGYFPSPAATRRVFMEEVLEFITEHILAYEVDSFDTLAAEEEAADVLVTLTGMLLNMTTIDSLRGAVDSVIAKNDAKNNDTHEVNSAGKIARKAVRS